MTPAGFSMISENVESWQTICVSFVKQLQIPLSSSIRNDIYEFIDFIKKNHFTIAQMWKDVIAYYDDLGMYEFHGNLVEYSAAFQYQIYDEAMVKEIQDLIKDIPVSKR